MAAPKKGKDFSNANTDPVYKAIEDATAGATPEESPQEGGSTTKKNQKRKFGEKLPEGMRKDHRVTFLLREKEWNALSSYARLKNTTPNAIVNDYVSKLIMDNADVIAQFDKLTAAVNDE